MRFSAPWSLSGMTVSLLTNGDPDEWDWSPSFVLCPATRSMKTESGLPLSGPFLPDQITSQKNEPWMEGSIVCRRVAGWHVIGVKMDFRSRKIGFFLSFLTNSQSGRVRLSFYPCSLSLSMLELLMAVPKTTRCLKVDVSMFPRVASSPERASHASSRDLIDC